jgi:hypothetical protein
MELEILLNSQMEVGECFPKNFRSYRREVFVSDMGQQTFNFTLRLKGKGKVSALLTKHHTMKTYSLQVEFFCVVTLCIVVVTTQKNSNLHRHENLKSYVHCLIKHHAMKTYYWGGGWMYSSTHS